MTSPRRHFVCLALYCVTARALLGEPPQSFHAKYRANATDMVWEEEGLQPVNPSLMYNLLQNYDVLICSCPKCGSTSLMTFVYKAVFNRSWPYGNSMPFRQNPYSPRWRGQFRRIQKQDLKDVKYLFGITRDPVDRLVSTWSSKYAHDGEEVGHVNGTDRDYMIPRLYNLARERMPEDSRWGISLTEFARVLKKVHDRGAARGLEPHVRPQQYLCFRDRPANQWTRTGPLSDEGLVRELAEALGKPGLKMPVVHASTSKTHRADFVPPEARKLLQEVTRGEYRALGLPLPEGA